MNHAVLPIMRRQCGGRIINLSSVAGSIPIPFQTYYSATKAAINAYTMALANEVKPVNTIGFSYQIFCVLAKLMPAKLLNALVGKLYGGWRNRT